MFLAPLAIVSLLSTASLRVDVQEAVPSSVPRGAQRVSMLSVTLSASCGADIPLRSMTLRHRGLGDASDLTAVYVTQGERRLTRGRSIASAREALTLVFPQGYVIPACASVPLTVRANFSAASAPAGEHRLLLSSPTDIDAAGATVTLHAPAVSPLRRTAGEGQGSIAVEFLPLRSRVSYGDKRTVARLRLTADGTHDQLLDALTLTNDGSARGTDLQNLSLQTQRGVSVARLSSLEGERAAFVFDPPFLLERSATVRMDLRADIRASRRRTIDFTLEEVSDLLSHRASGRR